MAINRLNHCMTLDTYKTALEEHSLIDATNEFCRESKTKLNIFQKFSDKDNLKMSVAAQTF